MFVTTHGIELFVETFGRPEDPALLLLMGNSAPGLMWPDAFCAMLAEGGLRVIRFDQRDTGLSTYLDFDATPYDLDDLGRDALGLLDALGVGRCHVAGLSQGGFLAYRLALQAPERLASLTALMSSPDLRPKNDAFAGAPPRPGELPRPAAAYVAAVIAANAERPADDEGVARQLVENFRLAKGPASPFDEAFWLELGRAMAAVPSRRRDGARARVANHGNHARAQAATPPFSAEDLGRITTPALVLHGGNDPIFPPAHAEWAAAALPDARLRVIPEMGHALDPAFFAPVAAAMLGFIRGV